MSLLKFLFKQLYLNHFKHVDLKYAAIAVFFILLCIYLLIGTGKSAHELKKTEILQYLREVKAEDINSIEVYKQSDHGYTDPESKKWIREWIQIGNIILQR